MWLMTRHGFVSVVAVDMPDYDLQVRARDRRTLEEFSVYMPGASPIMATPDRDYQFRFYTTRADFGSALAAMAQEITYPNFKDTLRGRLHDLAADLWWTIYQHYDGLVASSRKRR